MKNLLIILFLFLSACAKNGSDGATGPQGAQGLPGSNGINGTNGTNGTDNKIAGSISCMGYPASSGFWLNSYIIYNYTQFNSGDVFVSLSVNGLQQFNVSATSIYSSMQNGAIDGSITAIIDNSNWVKASLTIENKMIVEFKGDNPSVFTDTITCNKQVY